MYFLIFGRDDCPYCEAAKERLDAHGYEYNYLRLGVDFTREELIEMAPDAKTFPQIWVDEDEDYKHLGGYTDLVDYLTEGSEIDNILQTGATVRVTFTKADGTERTMLCTKNKTLIEEVSGAPIVKSDKQRKESDEVIPVYDLEANGWRSFRRDSVLSYDLVEEVVE